MRGELFMSSLVLVGALLTTMSVNATSENWSGSLRPSELFAHPARYLNKEIEVDIVEPLGGPSSSASLTTSEYGQVEVRIPESPSGSLALVPATFKIGDANRYKHKFQSVLQSPVRARGEFIRDDEMSDAIHRPVYLIRVASMMPIELGEPTPVTLEQIAKNPALWDRHYVRIAGTYESRFEVSALDKQIWVAFSATANNEPDRLGAVDSKSPGSRVRMSGILFAQPNARYGHLGAYRYQLTVLHSEALD
jgi:hypothetical protein